MAYYNGKKIALFAGNGGAKHYHKIKFLKDTTSSVRYRIKTSVASDQSEKYTDDGNGSFFNSVSHLLPLPVTLHSPLSDSIAGFGVLYDATGKIFAIDADGNIISFTNTATMVFSDEVISK